MQIRRILLVLAASAALAGGTAFAEPHGPNGQNNQSRGSQNQGHGNQQGHDNRGQQGGQHDWQGNKGGGRSDGRGQAWQGGGHGDRDWRDDRGNWHRDRDRYWRQDFGKRGFIGRDRIFFMLRQHNFNRFAGDPYWLQGRYVVKTYDRRGRVIFVEINPYTGQYIGVVRF